MTWDTNNGYIPRTIDDYVLTLTKALNTNFGTDFTEESVKGTNFYKYFYGGIQLIMEAEDIFTQVTVKMTDYIRTSNEKINAPKSTADGFMAATEASIEDGGLGLISSIKPITTEEEAGKIHICVDVDNTREDYAEIKQSILNFEHKWLTAGLYYYGSEAGYVTALNGQAFPYAYELPTIVNMAVKIAVKVSTNTSLFVMNENQIRDIFTANYAKFYRLGYAYEPEKYLEINRDLPFASEIILTYSKNGETYTDAVYLSAYNEKIINSSVTVEIS